MVEKLRYLLWKDLTLLRRAKETSALSIGFAVLLVVVTSFAFRRVGMGDAELRVLSPSILWIIFLFSGVVIFNHTFSRERENEALSEFLFLPVDPMLLYTSKFLVNLCALVLIELFVIGAHSLFFGATLGSAFGGLLVVAILFAIGFAALGTIFSALATAVRGRDVLLPLLLFPFLLPLTAGSIQLAQMIVITNELPVSDFWFTFLGVYDVVSLVLGAVLFEFVLTE